MVGREAYQNPGILASVDREILLLPPKMPIQLPWCAPCTRILSVN